jgi:AraC-like DNA-binding protein
LSIALYNAIILIGIIQGIIFSIWIFTSKKYRNNSSYYLAGTILCFSLENLQFSLNEMNFISESTLFNVVYVPWATLVPPFLLFYGVTFLNPELKISKRLKWLYLPFVFMLLVSSVYKVSVYLLQENGMMTTTINNITWIGETYGDFLNILFFVVIIIVLLNKIHNYEKSHVIYSRDTIKIQLNWLKLTLFVLVVLMIVWLSFTVGYLIDDELVFYPLYLAASLTIYWLGYIGIYKIGINEQRQKIREVVIHKEVLLKESSFINEQLSSFENLIKEKRLFLDGNLKLDTIASQLNVSKGHLSRTVNSELGISFSDYINNLRVEEAKSYLSNPEFDRYTLVAIGLEAGFNSKSTFYSTFKKFTGLTPLQFKNNLNN